MAQHGVCVFLLLSLLLLLAYFTAHRLPFPRQTKASKSQRQRQIQHTSRRPCHPRASTCHFNHRAITLFVNIAVFVSVYKYIYKIRNYNMLPQSSSHAPFMNLYIALHSSAPLSVGTPMFPFLSLHLSESAQALLHPLSSCY